MPKQSLTFLSHFLRAPQKIGAVFPSHAALTRTMLEPIDFSAVRTIVELGPGVGPFTAAILQRLNPEQRYVGIEINPAFVEMLRAHFPGRDFLCDNAENMEAALAARGVAQVEAVVSGLPWASLPMSTQDRIFAALAQSLRPGGLFITFAYLQGLALPGAWALRRRLRTEFAEVKTSRIVWPNLPPAFVYSCRRGQ